MNRNTARKLAIWSYPCVMLEIVLHQRYLDAAGMRLLLGGAAGATLFLAGAWWLGRPVRGTWLFAAVCLGHIALTVGNLGLDFGEGTPHEVTVVSSHPDLSRRRSRRWVATTTTWRTGRAREEIVVGHRPAAGDTLRLLVKPGAFGFPWVCCAE